MKLSTFHFVLLHTRLFLFLYFSTHLIFLSTSQTFNVNEVASSSNTKFNPTIAFQSKLVVPGKLMAFGDVNGDRFVDLIIWDATQRQLVVHLWTQSGQFESSSDYRWFFNKTSETIENVVLLPEWTQPLKFSPRFLVMYSDAGWLSTTYHFDFLTLQHQREKLNFLSSSLLPTHPTFFYSSTMDPLALIMETSKEDTKTTVPKVISFATLNMVQEPSLSYCSLAHPHSNAFLDFNGDCQAELFLQCKDDTYQIWNATHLLRQEKLPKSVGPLSFADVNADGSMDVIYVSCSTSSTLPPSSQQQQQQQHDCAIYWTLNTALSHDTCVLDSTFQLNFVDTSEKVFVLPSSSTSNALTSFFTTSNSVVLPKLQIGDVNLDGYPDVAFVWNQEIWILMNLECTPPSCSNPSKRQLVPLKIDEFHKLQKKHQVKQVAWFDLGEDGTLDLMIQYEDSKTKTDQLQFWAPQVHQDAFFLKTAVLQSGCTTKLCPGLTALTFGASFKFKFYDQDGKAQSAQAHQLFQHGYDSYPLPYSLVGLGRTHQFMERMSVGIVNAPINHFTSLIPNSELIFYPNLEQDAWPYQLVLRPSSYWYLHLIILCMSIFILGILALVLQWIENRENIEQKVYLL